MRNVTGPPVMGDDLYGRQQEIERLWARLDGGEHMLMLAPRRVGKTSLMLELHRDPYANWEVVYVDVKGGQGAADFVAHVLAALADLPSHRSWPDTLGLPRAVKDTLTSDLATASGDGSDLGEVLEALEADGYLLPRGDRVAFRSNLLRVWWRKHRAAP